MHRSQASASNPRWTEPWPWIHIGWPGREVAASLITESIAFTRADHGDTKVPELGTRIDEEEQSEALHLRGQLGQNEQQLTVQREADLRNTVTSESVPWRLSSVWSAGAAVPLKPGV